MCPSRLPPPHPQLLRRLRKSLSGLGNRKERNKQRGAVPELQAAGSGSPRAVIDTSQFRTAPEGILENKSQTLQNGRKWGK